MSNLWSYMMLVGEKDYPHLKAQLVAGHKDSYYQQYIYYYLYDDEFILMF